MEQLDSYLETIACLRIILFFDIVLGLSEEPLRLIRPSRLRSRRKQECYENCLVNIAIEVSICPEKAE